jgi:hypothetical protein
MFVRNDLLIAAMNPKMTTTAAMPLSRLSLLDIHSDKLIIFSNTPLFLFLLSIDSDYSNLTRKKLQLVSDESIDKPTSYLFFWAGSKSIQQPEINENFFGDTNNLSLIFGILLR